MLDKHKQRLFPYHLHAYGTALRTVVFAEEDLLCTAADDLAVCDGQNRIVARQHTAQVSGGLPAVVP